MGDGRDGRGEGAGTREEKEGKFTFCADARFVLGVGFEETLDTAAGELVDGG